MVCNGLPNLLSTEHAADQQAGTRAHAMLIRLMLT